MVLVTRKLHALNKTILAGVLSRSCLKICRQMHLDCFSVEQTQDKLDLYRRRGAPLLKISTSKLPYKSYQYPLLALML